MKITVKTMDGRTVTMDVDISNAENIMITDILPGLYSLGFGREESTLGLTYIVENDGTLRILRLLRIFVEILNGKTAIVHADSNETILDVKRKIQRMEEILPDIYNLTFGGNQLEDDHTLAAYNIQRGSILQSTVCRGSYRLGYQGPIQIYVTTVTGKSITLVAKSSDTVQSVKNEIWQKKHIWPDDQRLVFAGEKLDDTRKLADYGIQIGSLLHLAVRPPRKPRIYVLTPYGKRIILAAKRSYRIDMIKNAIERRERIPSSFQRLVFDDISDLQDGRTLGDYNVQDKSTLRLFLTQHPEPMEMEIIGKTQVLAFKKIKLVVKSTDKVCDVKNEIGKELGFTPSQLWLDLNFPLTSGLPTVTMEDGRALGYYNVDSESLLIAGPKGPPRPFRIFVKNNITGKRVGLKAESSDHIDDLKTKIQDKEGIPPVMQQLIFKDGIKLENRFTLAHYSIQPETVLSLRLLYRRPMLIFVKILVRGIRSTGETITLEAESSHTIGSIKTKLQNKVGLRPNCQRLIRFGTELLDVHTLADYDIPMESTLHLQTDTYEKGSKIFRVLEVTDLTSHGFFETDFMIVE